ncbi:MAG: zinc ribbon domain-containing protein [Polyangiaceae bacterium]
MSACARCESRSRPPIFDAPSARLPAPRPARVEPTDDAREPRARLLRCTECGAAVVFSAEKQGTACRFCGAVTKLEDVFDPVDQADAVLPFLVDPESAVRALRRWQSRLGFFRPRDVSRRATVDRVHAVHFAAWLFDADAHVTWAADSDADHKRSAWAPHAGELPMRFENVVVNASRGLSDAEVEKLSRGFDWEDVVACDPAEDAAIEPFLAQRSAAREIIARAVESRAEKHVAKSCVPGSRIRNCRVSVLVRRLSSRRRGLPAYIMTYAYDGKRYRAVVHGQDAELVLGDAPLSIAKIASAIALAMTLLGVLLWVVSRGHG